VLVVEVSCVEGYYDINEEEKVDRYICNLPRNIVDLHEHNSVGGNHAREEQDTDHKDVPAELELLLWVQQELPLHLVRNLLVRYLVFHLLGLTLVQQCILLEQFLAFLDGG